MPARPDVVGLVPAAGRATRLGALPCSKEILPVGFTAPGEDGAPPRPKAVITYLLDLYARAGVGRALVLLRRGKHDVAEHLGDAYAAEGVPGVVRLAYLVLDPTPSVAATLDRARPFLGDAVAALGFPDMLLEPPDVFARLLTRLDDGGADVVVAAVPSAQAWKCDMVELDARGRVKRVVVKDPAAAEGLRWAWTCAVYRPSFGALIAEAVAEGRRGEDGGELHVGYLLQVAVARGMKVRAVRFPGGSFVDVGTPADYRRAVRRSS